MGKLLRIENVFRQANDLIAEQLEAAGVHDSADNFICECADESCLARLDLTIAEFREIAAQPNRYVVRSGHDLEDIVEENDRYAIVEKDPNLEARESNPVSRG